MAASGLAAGLYLLAYMTTGSLLLVFAVKYRKHLQHKIVVYSFNRPKGNVVKNFLRLAAILGFVASMTTGCANHATANVSPSTNLAALKTMYVKKIPADGRKINELVADKFRSKGVTVTTGEEAPPANVDAVVEYFDKWMWDMTMYMLELTININDPKTGAQLATGNSLHTSLTRKSPQEMVDEVVDNIYQNKK